MIVWLLWSSTALLWVPGKPSPIAMLHTPTCKQHPIGPGTDSGLYNEGLFEGDIVVPAVGKNAVADKDLLWPTGSIVYRTDDNVGCPESPQCEILMRAIDHYHQLTCVRFKEWTGEDNYVKIFFNPDSGACWSPVGRSGDGEQLLSLGQRCWYMGIVVHELGHAVGFWHEMNRPDRDDWIYVYWNNIISGFSDAFTKHDATSVDTLNEHFDYRSIMMYDEYAFSKDGVSPTLQAKHPGVVIGPIWKKRGLSASDVRRIYKLYNCSGSRPLRGFPPNVKCSFNTHTCGFKNGGSAAWDWNTLNRTDGYVYSSFATTGTTPGYFLSVNMHPSTTMTRGCVRFWYLVRGNGAAYLKISQAYLDRVTELSYNPDKTYDLWESEEVHSKWVHKEVPISLSKPFKLIFMSTFNASCTQGTIALDDIEVLYRPCSAASFINSTVRPVVTTTTTTAAAISTTARPVGSTVVFPRPAITQPAKQPDASQSVTIFPIDFLTHSTPGTSV